MSSVSDQPGRYEPKAVFPLLYLAAFVLTLYDLLFSFFSQPPPALLGAALGATNQSIIQSLVIALVVVLCVTLLVEYIRLELFEERGLVCASGVPQSAATRFIEWAARLSVVAIVTLKVIKWSLFPEMFGFLFSLSSLLLVWNAVLVRLFGSRALRPNLAINSVATLAAGSGYFLASSADRQLEFGMALFLLIFVLVVVLGIANVNTIRGMASDVSRDVRDYILEWQPTGSAGRQKRKT